MPKKTDNVTIILATLIKTTIEYCAITMEPTNIISIAARAKLGSVFFDKCPVYRSTKATRQRKDQI